MRLSEKHNDGSTLKNQWMWGLADTAKNNVSKYPPPVTTMKLEKLSKIILGSRKWSKGKQM